MWLERRKKRLSPNHLYILNSVISLAFELGGQGRYNNAKRLIGLAIGVRECHESEPP